MRAALLTITTLASDEPLESRLVEVQKRLERTKEGERIELALEGSILAALRGMRAEAESLLSLARTLVTPVMRGPLELACALVMYEAGYSARMAGSLERAEASPGITEEPLTRALSQLFHAQLLMLSGTATAAVRAAMEGLASLPPEAARGPLTFHAHLVAAECLLAGGNAHAAAAYLDRMADMPGRSGILVARAEVLQARIGLAKGGPGTESFHLVLDRAIARFTRLGAQRDLALAYITYAHVRAADGTSVPSDWLSRAQSLLAKAGTAGDLRQLRHVFRTLGQRESEQIADADVVTAMETLRERHARLRDIVSAQRDARSPGMSLPTSFPNPLAKTVDQSLESMRLAQEELISILERTHIDRERVSHLMAVSQEVASIEGLEELLGAIPRLALVLLPGVTAALLELTESGPFLRQSGAPPPSVIPLARLREAAALALREGRLQVVSEEGDGTPLRRLRAASAGGGRRYAVVPLRNTGSKLVLVVGRVERRSPLNERELELLTVFGALAGTAIARARSSATLQRVAARDAAASDAVWDGVLTLDESGTLRTLNQVAARMLRVELGQVLGRRPRDNKGLAPLAEALGSGKPLNDELIGLAHGDVLVRAQPHEGGMVVALQELTTAQQLAQKLVGSQARFTFEDLVGQTPAFLACLEQAKKAAQSNVPILITGERGTGKEMLAQAIHRASPSATQPFLGVSVAALPREQLEGELFGYERGGAPPGSRAGSCSGRLELVNRGTLLLDEVGDLAMEVQAKLLRSLKDRVLQRMGDTRDIPFQGRVMATSRRELEEAIEEGSFRRELLHHLQGGVHLRIPALRERRGDIPLLVEHHLRRCALRTRRRSLRLAPRVMAAFEAYDWPGNVRELVNLLESAVSRLPADQDTITGIPLAIERALQPPKGRATGSAAPQRTAAKKKSANVLRSGQPRASRPSK